MTRTVEEILGKDSIAKLQEPIETARGLPRAAYTTQEFFDLEQERLFPRIWQGVGFVDDVPEPGDAIPITVSGLPLILVHDRNGTIRCFHNVCRHRATIVLQKPEKGLSNLQCPYHAWTWNLEGNLKATPYFDGTPNSENFSVDKDQNGLVPVRCDVWNKVVFVNLEGNAEPLADYLAPADKMLSHLDLDSLQLGHRFSWEFKGNWKLANENWEVYHHVWVHYGIFDKMSEEVDFATGKPYTLMTAEGNVLTLRGGENRPPRKRSGPAPTDELPKIPTKNGTEGISGATNAILPNVTASLNNGGYAPVVYIPIAPDRTLASMAWYFAGDGATAEKYAEAREERLNRWLGPTRVIEDKGGIRSQDHKCFELQQAARYSPAADSSVQFSPTWETNVQYFQNWLVKTLS